MPTEAIVPQDFRPSDFAEDEVEYFYKYVRFSEGALKIITDGTIRYTCPLDFNDPFDCFPSLPRGGDFEIDLRAARRLAKNAGYSAGKFLQEKTKIVRRLKDEVQSGRYLQGLVSKVGVLSLSKNPLNLLMWSHYADFHRGFVLEFRIPIESQNEVYAYHAKNNHVLVPLPVVYTANRPVFGMTIEGDDEWDRIEATLLTKSQHWAYEEEHRAFSIWRDPGVHEYERDLILSSVIAGMRIGERYSELLKAIERINAERGLNISCHEAVASSTEYAITVPGHPRLGI